MHSQSLFYSHVLLNCLCIKAISFPIEALADPNIFAVATREVFAPFQIIIEYGDGPNDNIDVVLGAYTVIILPYYSKHYQICCYIEKR